MKDAIEILFGTLSEKEQVEVLVALYNEMYDRQKDSFLRETNNN